MLASIGVRSWSWKNWVRSEYSFSWILSGTALEPGALVSHVQNKGRGDPTPSKLLHLWNLWSLWIRAVPFSLAWWFYLPMCDWPEKRAVSSGLRCGMMEFIVRFNWEAHHAFSVSVERVLLNFYFSFSFLFNKSNLSTQEWKRWQQPRH